MNDGMSDFPLRYSTVQDAIDSVMVLGRHSLMAKIDIRNALPCTTRGSPSPVNALAGPVLL